MAQHLSYFVCATPRSGSSLLAGLLKSTGVAGCPEEYFWRGGERFWGKVPLDDYLDGAKAAGTTANGVFGARVMWGYFGNLLAALAGAGASLKSVFPDLHFVWLRREDIVAQAVSHLRAIQTQVWYAGDERRPGGEPRFDAAALDQLIGEIAEHDRAWADWFARNGVEPMRVTHEQVAADPVGTTRAVLEFLGLPRDVPVEVMTARQSDRLNAEWVERYRALRPVRG